MIDNPIPQIVEALQRGNLALFVGGDLPPEATGLPNRAGLAAALAERLGLGGPPPSWPEVAARYEAGAGRTALIRWLKDQLEPVRHPPGPVYELLAGLPATTYITSAYDDYVYRALEQAGRQPNLPVVGADSLGLLDAGQPTVVYLLGQLDQPLSLALTTTDLNRLPQTKAQVLAGLVQPSLANKTVLIVGQDLRDVHFKAFYATALFQAGTIRPPAIAAWPGLDGWEVQTWRDQGVRVVDAPPMELPGKLAAAIGLGPAGGRRTLPQDKQADKARDLPRNGIPPIDPDNPPFALLRELLIAAFTSETLHRFCYDRPDFRPVVNQISPDHGLDDMVDRLLVYCEKNLLWDELLAGVQKASPRQYDRFAPRLAGAGR